MTDITKVVTKTALNVSIEELVFVPQNNCSTVNCTGLVCSILYVHCTLHITDHILHISHYFLTLHIAHCMYCIALGFVAQRQRETNRHTDRQRDIQTHRETERERERQTYRHVR